MCGIVGLLLKDCTASAQLGRLLLPMFDCMGDRGPDSAGLAVFQPSAETARRFNLYANHRNYNGPALISRFQAERDARATIEPLEKHAILKTGEEPAQVKAWIQGYDPSLHLLSVGHSIDVYKDEGHPCDA
jgi:hypothetical protein